MAHVTVWMEEWQQSCCGEPFRVGGAVEWVLLLRPDPKARDEFATKLQGEVELLTERGHRWALFRSGELNAVWAGDELPPAGPISVIGLLAEEHHGGFLPDDPPRTRGTVRDIQVLTTTLRTDGGGEYRHVESEDRLRRVIEPPRVHSFERSEGQIRHDEGYVIDLEVGQAAVSEQGRSAHPPTPCGLDLRGIRNGDRVVIVSRTPDGSLEQLETDFAGTFADQYGTEQVGFYLDWEQRQDESLRDGIRIDQVVEVRVNPDGGTVREHRHGVTYWAADQFESDRVQQNEKMEPDAKVYARFEDHDHRGWEGLFAKLTGEGTATLLSVPLFAEGIGYLDEVAILENEDFYEVDEVVRSAGRVCFRAEVANFVRRPVWSELAKELPDGVCSFDVYMRSLFGVVPHPENFELVERTLSGYADQGILSVTKRT